MRDQTPYRHPIRVATLRSGGPTAFQLGPDAKACAAIAGALRIPKLRKLRFAGTLLPLGRADWQLRATLRATVTQDCVATLQPVVTRIDEPVLRTYLADVPAPGGAEEIEMPQDDSVEPLPEVIDLGAVLVEALALALPQYPRVAAAGPGDVAYPEPNRDQVAEAPARPFAALQRLRDKLVGTED